MRARCSDLSAAFPACAVSTRGASSLRKKYQGGAAMTGLSRRDFIKLTGSATAVAVSGHAHAAMGPNDKFDLVIKGGDVLDPSQSLRGKRDIGIRWGVIEAIENDIPAAS